MNWIERLYELKGKDLYSQNGESFYLEYILHWIVGDGDKTKNRIFDIGGGDGFYLSNSRHLSHLGWITHVFDKELGHNITCENIVEAIENPIGPLSMFLPKTDPAVFSIDIDGNDFWILDKILKEGIKPKIIIAEFNASYTDSRAIKYNPDHVWAGDSYYGFTFKAGEKLAELHGYKVIFQIANMNMIMVRADLIGDLFVPPVTYKQSDYFKLSDRTDWITI